MDRYRRELVAESNLYRNPADTRDQHSSEKADRFILLFRKP